MNKIIKNIVIEKLLKEFYDGDVDYSFSSSSRTGGGGSSSRSTLSVIQSAASEAGLGPLLEPLGKFLGELYLKFPAQLLMKASSIPVLGILGLLGGEGAKTWWIRKVQNPFMKWTRDSIPGISEDDLHEISLILPFFIHPAAFLYALIAEDVTEEIEKIQAGYKTSTRRSIEKLFGKGWGDHLSRTRNSHPELIEKLSSPQVAKNLIDYYEENSKSVSDSYRELKQTEEKKVGDKSDQNYPSISLKNQLKSKLETIIEELEEYISDINLSTPLRKDLVKGNFITNKSLRVLTSEEYKLLFDLLKQSLKDTGGSGIEFNKNNNSFRFTGGIQDRIPRFLNILNSIYQNYLTK